MENNKKKTSKPTNFKKVELDRGGKQLSNPFSTGGGGVHFETHVQAAYVVLMLTGGCAPGLPYAFIKKIILQGKYAGYETDDLIVFLESANGYNKHKILGQIKHSIGISKKDKLFGDVIQAAWKDFKNAEFNIGKDIIALITGPLSASDCENARTILEWARHSESAEEFLKKIKLAKFSSKSKQEKLEAFKYHLTLANSEKEVSDEDLFQFIRHFHILGYDLDIKAGVTLALINSLIGMCSDGSMSTSLWLQVVNEVQFANKNACTITYDSLPEELREAFKKKTYETIPSDLTAISVNVEKRDWKHHKYSFELSIAMLLGNWNDKSEEDREIVSRMAGEDYSTWIIKFKNMVNNDNSPVTFKNGIWKVVQREQLWKDLGGKIFDNNLMIFKESVIEVLSERDPQFYVNPENRFAASIYGKKLKYSAQLRKGLAESLVLFEANSSVMCNCSLNILHDTVYILFKNADWILWGSLNSVLPILAEAAPTPFLEVVENILQQQSDIFDQLFLQESSGITGRNYLTGILWAMELLAWEEKYLVQVTIILGDLASRDPGGSSSNRPLNSLITIFLPWFPQTLASVEKRKVALSTLKTNYTNIAWNVLTKLMPKQRQTSSGSYKPQWRNKIGERNKLIGDEYKFQVEVYAELIVNTAKHDIGKLKDLIRIVNSLPYSAFNEVLETLSSYEILMINEYERKLLWTELKDLISKHRKFEGASWALSCNNVLALEKIEKILAPKDPLYLYQGLFDNREITFYDKGASLEDQREKLAKERQVAVKIILEHGNFSAITQFANLVEAPQKLGYALGILVEDDIESHIIPGLLQNKNDSLSQLAGGYVLGRYNTKGWDWVEGILKPEWDKPQLGQFLTCLPFSSRTWNLVINLLGESEIEYWSKVSASFEKYDAETEYALEKLLEYGRNYSVIECIYNIISENYLSINTSFIIKTLLSAINSREAYNSMHQFYIVELIKFLQQDQKCDKSELSKVEWGYLSILENYDAIPLTLENELASNTRFFCEVIKLIYRSEHGNESTRETSATEKNIATQAFRLLNEWRTLPGTKEDGSISGEYLAKWINEVKVICAESGHLEVALIQIGKVLMHAPADSDGLWIEHSVASILNEAAHEKIRDGFFNEYINSRGAYWVDSTGNSERELANGFREKCNDAENAGYFRLAITLRNLAEFYDKEAERPELDLF